MVMYKESGAQSISRDFLYVRFRIQKYTVNLTGCDENHQIPLPVDILFVDVGPVNNLMRDGLICHLVCATNANRLVPGHLTTKAPGRQQQQYTKHKKKKGLKFIYFSL